MHGHELALTAFFNEHFAGVANSILGMVGLHAHDPAKPWTNFMVMQLLVALLLLLLPLAFRRLSMDKPGGLQHMFESIYLFMRAQAKENAGHDGPKYLPFFLTLFLFILFCNLIGVVPGFESPTMSPAVPLGCAVLVFVVFNTLGVKEQGIVNYLKHFGGPVWWLFPFIFVVEMISLFIRPVSLTIRLFANMLAGEQVTIGFLALVPFIVPVIFMALHVFVSFLQSFIFSVLTMGYIGQATEHAEEH
jgi:F-type H+-transporting ATPase subunit a